MVFCLILIIDAAMHPPTYKLFILVEDTVYAGARLRAQTQRKMTLHVALLHLIQMDSNESFRQVLERWQRILWPDFEKMGRDLVTCNGDKRLGPSILQELGLL